MNRDGGDAAVPSSLRRELAGELRAARQLPAGEAARSRVTDAQVALGERSDPDDGRRARLAAAMRALLWHRRADSTICPSDAARVAGGDSWRDLMETARDVAAGLARDGVITVRQHGEEVDIAAAAGPVRLARGPRWPSDA
jgi:hypothetical protein